MSEACQIDVGDRAIWVNDRFGCLGRFGLYGIDVHHALDANGRHRDGSPEGSECLFCTHAPTTISDWYAFCAAMLRFHGVTIPDDIEPSWLRPRTTSQRKGRETAKAQAFGMFEDPRGCEQGRTV